ncbi:MAG: GTPase Era [Desulfobacteraceae bacterium]|nr:GTPase Era [Desulfobacteraceae bacterium]
MKNNSENFKCGYVAIIGAPNAGKSTLLNKILGQKIAITSKKPQTTRNRILGISNNPNSQIIFLDTPGIHKATSLLNRKIVAQAVQAVKDVDLIFFMKDVASKKNKEAEEMIIKQLISEKKDVILVLNKIDLVKKPDILSIIEESRTMFDFKTVIPVSAKKGLQIDDLLVETEKILPKGPQLFPKDVFTDISERFLVTELIREKIFRFTGMEIPYSTAVTIDEFNIKKKVIHIHATIHVNRKSQKGIILGKKGAMIRKIGEKARIDIEKMTGSKIFLELFVRITKDWTRNERHLNEFGL